MEALEALTLRRFVEEVEEIWKRREGRKPDRHLDKKINVMTMSSYQNCPERRTKIELVERLLFIES